MPKIERFTSSGRARTTSTVSQAAAGQVGRASAQTALAVGGLAATVGGIATQEVRRQALVKKQSKDADDVAFVTERINRLSRNEAEELSNVKTTGQLADMEKLQENFNLLDFILKY